MANWWVSEEDGVNWLGGVDDDPTNPLRIPDITIVEFLMTYPQARLDYDIIVPTMSAGEQARLAALLETYPMVANVVMYKWDNHTTTDAMQRRHNTAGIHLRITRQN